MTDQKATFSIFALLMLFGATVVCAAQGAYGRMGDSRVTFSFGGGLAAAGDLFSVDVPLTIAWEAPSGSHFQAKRYTVTLDEDVQLNLGLAYAFGRNTSLRLFYSWSSMDATALANDSQVVTPVLWDHLSFQMLGAALRRDLARTPLAPYALLGGGWLTIDAGADALDQQAFVPFFGFGLHTAMAPGMRLRLEALDTVYQIESQGLVRDQFPPAASYHRDGPQHLVNLTLMIEMGF